MIGYAPPVLGVALGFTGRRWFICLLAREISGSRLSPRRGGQGQYPTGVSATDAEMSALSLHRSELHGDWSYELRPR